MYQKIHDPYEVGYYMHKQQVLKNNMPKSYKNYKIKENSFWNFYIFFNEKIEDKENIFGIFKFFNKNKENHFVIFDFEEKKLKSISNLRK